MIQKKDSLKWRRIYFIRNNEVAHKISTSLTLTDTAGKTTVRSDNKQVIQQEPMSDNQSNPISHTHTKCSYVTKIYHSLVCVCVRSSLRMLVEQWNTSAAPFSHALCLFKVTSEKGICIGKRNSECTERRCRGDAACGPASQERESARPRFQAAV